MRYRSGHIGLRALETINEDAPQKLIKIGDAESHAQHLKALARWKSLREHYKHQFSDDEETAMMDHVIDSAPINRALAGKHQEPEERSILTAIAMGNYKRIPKYKERHNLLLSAAEKVPLPHDTQVYSGIHFDPRKYPVQEGIHAIRVPSWLHTSHFVGQCDGFSPQAILRLRIPKGAAGYVPDNQDELEHVLPPDSKIHISATKIHRIIPSHESGEYSLYHGILVHDGFKDLR